MALGRQQSWLMEINVMWSLTHLTLHNIAKWSNTLKQFVGSLLTNCLSVFDILWAWRSKCKGSISILRTLAFILLTVRKSQFCFQIRLLRTQLIGNYPVSNENRTEELVKFVQIKHGYGHLWKWNLLALNAFLHVTK